MKLKPLNELDVIIDSKTKDLIKKTLPSKKGNFKKSKWGSQEEGTSIKDDDIITVMRFCG